MLRGDASPRGRAIGIALAAAIGAIAASLVALGNPGNMGICGACFARDVAGSLGLQTTGPAIMRPEFAATALGAFAAALVSGRGIGRSGGHAGARFVLCLFMAFGALVFLGCPFRLLQRLGGGDPTAWLALPGFVAGVGLGMTIERRGPTIGKTQPAPAIVGLLGPLAAAGLLVLLVAGALRGPGPGDAGPPAHAPWLASLGLALVAGALLSATGFCAVSAARQVFRGPRWMLAGAAALIGGYTFTMVIGGASSFGTSPVAHGDWLWNVLGLALAGLTGALAGGCPVRQVVMAGEGNADAFTGVAGLVAGGALAHTLGIAAKPAAAADAGGVPTAGKIAIAVGFAVALAYGWLVTRPRNTPPA